MLHSCASSSLSALSTLIKNIEIPDFKDTFIYSIENAENENLACNTIATTPTHDALCIYYVTKVYILRNIGYFCLFKKHQHKNELPHLKCK